MTQQITDEQRENAQRLAAAQERARYITRAASNLTVLKDTLTNLIDHPTPHRAIVPGDDEEWFETKTVFFDLPGNEDDLIVSIRQGLRKALIGATFLADRAQREAAIAEANLLHVTQTTEG